MSDFIVSLNENVLKVTSESKNGVGGISRDVPKELVDGTKILDVNGFAGFFNGVILELYSNAGISKKDTLTILVEPQDVILRFVTVAKGDENVSEYIVAKIKEDLSRQSLDDLYFSYQKIAPFVYQFVAIERQKLDMYLELANALGVELKGICPWVLLLPKFVDGNDPSIFISKSERGQIIALSELNGIYFSEVYSDEKNIENLQELVRELSIYQRLNPINKVYTMDYETFSLDPKYEMHELEVPGIEADNKQFSVHFLYINILEKDPDLLGTQLNMLTLLPVPAKKNSNALVYVGVFVGAVLVVGGIFGFALLSHKDNNQILDSNVAQNVDENPTVLSENEEVKETTEGTESSDNTEEVKDLDKSSLNIRVENGAGIAGIAAKTQGFLEELGYTVIEIGNAEDQTREDTLVKFKTSKLEYRDLLVSDMSEEYKTTVEEGLDDDLEHDVLVIIGKE